MLPETFTFKRDFLDQLDIPVFVKDKAGIYTYCNSQFSDFLKMPTEKIIGSTVYDISPHALAVKYEIADKALLNGDSSHQKYTSMVVDSQLAQAEIIFNKSVIYDSNHMPSGIIGLVTNAAISIKPHNDCIKKLTGRELSVLTLLMQGSSVKSMALELLISINTVNGYLKSIYLKLDAHSKNEAVYKAFIYLRSTQWSQHSPQTPPNTAHCTI